MVEGLLSCFETVGKGGLLITLAQLKSHCIQLKSSIDITNAQLFSETQGRYVVSVKSGKTLNIDNAIEIGLLTDSDNFKVTTPYTEISENVPDLNKYGKGQLLNVNYSGLNEEKIRMLVLGIILKQRN